MLPGGGCCQEGDAAQGLKVKWMEVYPGGIPGSEPTQLLDAPRSPYCVKLLLVHFSLPH